MYPLRVVFAFIVLATLAAILTPIALLRPKHRNNMGDICSAVTAVLYAYWGTKLEIENEYRLTPDQPSIIIANHQDTEDMFFAESIVKRGTVTLGKWELLYIPFIGWLFFLAGNITIKRAKKEKAQHALGVAARKMQEENLSVLIFPEGTRNWGKPLPFKLGAFKLAIEAQAPIQPVCFSLRKNTMNYNKWRSGTVRVKCLEPISTVGLTQEDAIALADLCQTLIENQCIEITQSLIHEQAQK